MAVPKNKRSKAKVKQRGNIIFFDQLCGNWLRHRDWFYRRLSVQRMLPPCSEGVGPATPRPVLFPGFWSNRRSGASASCLPPSSHKQIHRRWLGQAPSGRQVNNVDTACAEAKKLFYKSSLGYAEFAKRIESLRLLAFWALVTGLTVDLVMRPPQSSYWAKWNLLKMPSRLMDKFGQKPAPVQTPETAKLGPDHLTDAAREYHRVCNI
ncbi:uncharacterized protein BXIN_1700 [Babesia sp. Xinjiang]|uniref:uncharacterized protein n=1 Tax=Babesia sp. Xinjiang TaxID=462227 RepID=UPI000A24DAB0|nr:uncharacterized protein BXIN_1722 [Babesia sp. Xinjiang]XP_028871364.1 uncharacterized protein BXIN_1700 [Babesia sp. Xinjiang]ORM40871.1 hypothetical protein BXIN_1722 [Babesia sp. Xinjiang]ORM40908.1 hypothetical protein BXIN_1700 [Babesia sp. Xinjiang]